jgi:hypothetical protein
MSEELWVEYKIAEETFKSKVSIEGCVDVDDFIKKIRNEPQLGIPKDFRVTLCTPSGETIDAGESPSSLLEGNTSKNPLHLQVSAPLPVSVKPAPNTDLTLFWSSLHGLQDKEGFLHFPVKPKFFPEKLNSLYIRKAYEDLFKIICDNLNSNNETKERIHRMAITGTPGTGKSVFLFYILWRLANMETTKTVILHREKDVEAIHVFQNDGCWKTRNIDHIDEFLEDPATWYLTDALLSQPGEVPAVTILVSSPAKEYYSKFLTYLPNSSLHYLPVWSLEELKLVAEFYSKSPEVVEGRFDKMGGNARYVLEENKDLEILIEEALNKLMRGKSPMIPLGEGSREEDISHRIIHFEVKPPDYIHYKMTIASDYVAGKLSERLRGRHELELIQFLTFFDHVSFMASTVGHLFEGYAHKQLSAGGEFLVRSLDEDIEEKVTFPKRQLIIFVNFSECTDPNIYYKPTAKNFACIDSLILGTGYFQMTISMEHKIVEEGMKEIKKVMKMEKLYFVVPHTKYKEFKKQELIKGTKNNIKRDDKGTSTGRQTFEEGESSNPNNKRRKIKRVNNNQTLQEDLVRQYVISIPLNAEVSKWLHNYEQRKQEVQQGGS